MLSQRLVMCPRLELMDGLGCVLRKNATTTKIGRGETKSGRVGRLRGY